MLHYLRRHSGTFYSNHTAVSLDAEDKDSTNTKYIEEFCIFKEYSYCSNHGRYPIENFFRQDDCLCCAACSLITHRKCRDVISLRSDNLEKDAKIELEKIKNIIDNVPMLAKN